MKIYLLTLTVSLFGFCIAADSPTLSDAELRQRIADGKFREVIAATTLLREDAGTERRFLAEVALDFARFARADAGGAETLPVGKRLRVFEGKYYAVLETTGSFGSANRFAESVGGRLPVIDSVELQQFLVGELLMPAHDHSTTATNTRLWTGMTGRFEDGKFLWTHIEEAEPPFISWDSSQPRKHNDDHYALVIHSDSRGKWRTNEAEEDNDGTEEYPVFALIEWWTIPSETDATRDPARDATAPLTAIEGFDSFTSLRKMAADAITEKAVKPTDAEFSRLKEGYLAALKKAGEKATAEGSLEKVVSCRNEIRRVEAVADLAAVPVFASVATPEHLADLRTTFVENATALRRKRSEATRPILSTYREALAEVESELTVAYRIPDALAVRSLRNDLAGIVGEEREVTAGVYSSVVSKKLEFKLQLDIPDRNWPTKSYDPGKPGKLGACGVVMPGDKPVDLSRAEGIGDFVKVGLFGDGWVALRSNGSLVSTKDDLNGKTGVWRMIPKHGDGAIFFWKNNTVTINSRPPLSYKGVTVPAKEVDWVSSCNGGVLITMKDGRVWVIGDLPDDECGQVEQAFSAVTRHGSYRYGVYGITETGEPIMAVLAPQERMEKELAVRLPEMKRETFEGLEFTDLFTGSGPAMYLTEDGECRRADSGWFPRDTVRLFRGYDDIDPRVLEDLIACWSSSVKVTLTKRGRWHVFHDFKPAEGLLNNPLEEMLEKRKSPLKDLRLLTANNGEVSWTAFAVWIE